MKRKNSPKSCQKSLALEITSRFHGDELAKRQKMSLIVFLSKNLLPNSDIDEFSIDSEIWVVEAIVKCGLASSNSQARRHINAKCV